MAARRHDEKGKPMKRIFILAISLLVLFSPTFVLAGEIINSQLPSWINMDVEFRHRLEFKDNFDFNDAVNDEDTYNLWRTRISLLLKPTDWAKLFVQFQDATVSDQDIGSRAPNENRGDFRQGYLELVNVLQELGDELPAVSLRLGRQELSYGAQRLVGGFDWSNIAQTFDAGKVMVNIEEWHLAIDGFGGSKTPTETPVNFDNWYDNSTQDVLAGYYATYTGIDGIAIEQYFLKRLADTRLNFGPSGMASADVYTSGARLKGKIADTQIDYELEAAKQWGEFGTLDIDAQMANAIIGYTFAETAWTPRFAFEYNYGSGDDDSGDGELNTFNNLFPTNHLFYGYMDRASLQNLNNYRFQVSAKPNKKTVLQLDLHLIYLDTSNDSLYHAGRGVVRTAGASGADDHVGNELDLLVKYKVNDHLNVMGGYSRFFAGEFLDDTGAHDDGDFFYLQSVFSF
jgi:hypothetical protein